MTDYNPSMCYGCERKSPDSLTCEAFPDGIPDEILVFGADHRLPFPGDHGKQFMLGDSPDAEQNFIDWQRAFAEQ